MDKYRAAHCLGGEVLLKRSCGAQHEGSTSLLRVDFQRFATLSALHQKPFRGEPFSQVFVDEYRGIPCCVDEQQPLASAHLENAMVAGLKNQPPSDDPQASGVGGPE